MVNKQEYDVMFEDIGAHQRLIVFQEGKRIGHRDLGLLTDTGRGVIDYCIKKILMDIEMEEFLTNPNGEIVI
jgi:hypothetical protein